MLLHIMSLPRDIRRDHFARAQPHTRDFALAGVGFLGFVGADAEADAFHFGPVNESGRGAATGALFNAAAAEDLVVGCAEGRVGCEGACVGEKLLGFDTEGDGIGVGSEEEEDDGDNDGGDVDDD